jgi:hypothetical protein
MTVNYGKNWVLVLTDQQLQGRIEHHEGNAIIVTD